MKRISNILIFVVAFLLGMAVCVVFLEFQGKKSNEKLVLDLLKEENTNLSRWAKRCMEASFKHTENTAIYDFEILNDMDAVSDYFEAILFSKKYDYFSMDTVKSILENSMCLDDISEKIRQISLKNNTPIENELYINLYYNLILNKGLKTYKERSLMAIWGECVVVPKKDTVKIGDFYEANIYFVVKDITQTYKIIDTTDWDKIICEGDVYREKTTVKGLNTRTGLLPFFNGYETLYYPVEFSFYVK